MVGLIALAHHLELDVYNIIKPTLLFCQYNCIHQLNLIVYVMVGLALIRRLIFLLMECQKYLTIYLYTL